MGGGGGGGALGFALSGRALILQKGSLLALTEMKVELKDFLESFAAVFEPRQGPIFVTTVIEGNFSVASQTPKIQTSR